MSRAARIMRIARRDDLLAQPVRRERMLEALDRLPEADRLVLALHLCEGFATAEIAETLALPSRTVVRTRDRAMIRLRRALAGTTLPKPAAGPTDLRSAM